MAATDEVWKPIPGFDGYEASTEGRIRNARGHILTGTVTKQGYRQVNVRGARARTSIAVHRLVAAAFLSSDSFGLVVAHLNGDKFDNRPSNLTLKTPADNAQHAAALGLSWPTRIRGELNPNAKLTIEQVREMRSLHKQGASLASLGRRFGVTERAAHRVVKRKDWKHVL